MKLKCHKCSERAVFHITEIDDSASFKEIHLCAKCAQDYLREAEETQPATQESAVAAALAGTEIVSSGATCSICKITFADFRSTGRLGCPNDYEVFREELKPLLENIHNSLRHIGKVPRRLPADTRLQTQLIQLRKELQHAVAVEDYEKAAQLRDQIDALRKDG